LFVVYCLLAIVYYFFLRSGQAENFVRPENKFLVSCAQNPSFLLTMQRYEKFKGLVNKIPKNHTFWSLFFALILQINHNVLNTEKVICYLLLCYFLLFFWPKSCY